jgi:hypothetical protein
MTIGFQFLDKHLQKRIEESTHRRALIDTTRILTNPPQSIANLVRFRRPWFSATTGRDGRAAKSHRLDCRNRLNR